MPPLRPLAALPVSRSSELNGAVCPASSDSVSGPYDTPVSSIAMTLTSPDSAEWFTTRTKPCSVASDADGNIGTKWVAALETLLVANAGDPASCGADAANSSSSLKPEPPNTP